MKVIRSIFLLGFLVVFCSSCHNDDTEYEFVNVATPEVLSKVEFRNSIEVLAPQSIDVVGKIYAYNDLIFVSDISKGIHIIDNANPSNPVVKSFIRIPGNVDVSIKNNYLYADSYIDLIVFDISDINHIKKVAILEDIYNAHNYNLPEDAQYFDYINYNPSEQVIVGWTMSLQRREVVDERDIFVLASSESNVGTGGSLARFQIVDDYLYAVGSYEMNIFNIQNLEAPVLENTQYAGWNIETMFETDNYLYLGSTNGMYIYSLDNPALPEYISEFTHWEGCDPVVVDGDYAYLTLRGGNMCGRQESELQVVDISDKFNPYLAGTYPLSNPYGLGFKGDVLYVCDGTSGLKIFDKTNPLELSLVNHFDNVIGKDVIPLGKILIMIGENTLYQYQYGDNTLSLISTFQL